MAKDYLYDKLVGAYKEYYMYSWEDTAGLNGMAGGTGVQFDDVSVRMDSDADFEMMKRIHVATSDQIRIKFQDDTYGRQFQNAAANGLDLRAVSGTKIQTTGVVDVGISLNNFMPFIMPRPYLIRAGTNFTCSFADFSGSANTIRLTMHGAKIRSGQAPWDRDWNAKPPFIFSTGSTAVAAGGTASVQISMDIGAHFIVQKIVGTRTSQTPALVTIKTGGYDKQWMDKAVHFDNLVGNGQFPNVLPAPRLVERGATINVTIQNLSATVAGTYEIAFVGLKLF